MLHLLHEEPPIFFILAKEGLKMILKGKKENSKQSFVMVLTFIVRLYDLQVGEKLFPIVACQKLYGSYDFETSLWLFEL